MSYPTAAGETTTLPRRGSKKAPTPGSGESLIPRLLPHHGLSQMGEAWGQPPHPKAAGHRPPSQVMENRLDGTQPILNYLNWVPGKVGQGGAKENPTPCRPWS